MTPQEIEEIFTLVLSVLVIVVSFILAIHSLVIYSREKKITPKILRNRNIILTLWLVFVFYMIPSLAILVTIATVAILLFILAYQIYLRS